MDGRTVAAAWKAIDDEELDRVMAAGGWRDHRAARVVWRSPRPFSAAARVRTAEQELFVKRHDARVRDAAALREEHRFMDHLRKQGVPVPRVLALLQDDAGNAYEFHSLAEGLDLYEAAHSWTLVRGTSHARALGQALARLHGAARGFRAAARPARPLLAGIDVCGAGDLRAALSDYVRARPSVERFLAGSATGKEPARAGCTGAVETALRTIADVLGPWHEGLRPFAAALERTWVHNDWHASNLFWSGAGEHAGVCAVIDFGLCNLGWAVADLATALERNTIAWLEIDEASRGAPQGRGIGRPDLACALLEGYRSVRELSEAERLALPWVMGLAHVEFALSEVDYFCRITGNLEDAALACPKFLLGHVRWFEGEDGQSYLDALRESLRVGLRLEPR